MDPITLPSDFSEFLQSLNESGVEYLLIGGWAVSLHGYARYTADIDFWFGREPDNATRLIAALRNFGVDDPAVTVDALLTPGKLLRMGRPPMRIELLNQIDGVEFRECYRRRIVVTLGNLDVPVIARDDLLANKRASNRPKDLADIDELTR